MNRNEFMVIFVITFLVIMAWLIFDLLHTRASVNVTSQLQDTLSEVNPNFDQNALNQVSQVPNLNRGLLPTLATTPPSPQPNPVTKTPLLTTPIATSSSQTASSSATTP